MSLPRIAMAQLNFLVGDIPGNCQKIIQAANTARDQHQADLVLFPELALSGYPPEDLLFRPGFQLQIQAAIEQLKTEIRGIDIVFGAPEYSDQGLFNAAYWIANGQISGIYRKQCLPNYGVFDEARYFAAGDEPLVVELAGRRIGVVICEDIWHSAPAAQSAATGAELICCLNASPFHQSKTTARIAAVAKRCVENNVSIIYTNLVGGQDELVFDGHSFALNPQGQLQSMLSGFGEELVVADLQSPPIQLPPQNGLKDVYDALVLGVRDYVNKNGFPGVVLGLSGGVDSALTLAIAADALGGEKVEAISLPSRYTAGMSNDDAAEQARLMGVSYSVIPIEGCFEAFQAALAPRFEGLAEDTTEENMQARARGVLLMSISNKTGKMVLTTSNKSETAIGYATLYGDMAGGFGPLKDVSKTLVYQLCDYRNSISAVIPQRVLTRAPSAELRAEQKDSDSLPPYDVLDPILAAWIEGQTSVADIVAQGYEQSTVQRIVGMVTRNEYKRRQAAPGVKITGRAFGRDRRYPITSRYLSKI